MHSSRLVQPSEARMESTSPSPRISTMMVAAVSQDISRPLLVGRILGAVVGGQKHSEVVGQSGSSGAPLPRGS